MTIIINLAFLIATLVFFKRYVDAVKQDSFQTAANHYFSTEKFFLLRFLIVSSVALLLIIIFKKKALVLSLLATLIYAIYIAYNLYLKAEDFIGKNERDAIRLYTTGKLIGIFTLLSVISQWLC